MKTHQLIPAILIVSIAGLLPLSAQCQNGGSQTSSSSSSSTSEGSSSSESMTRKVVIINGETVVDETTHTRNGTDVSQEPDAPAPDGEPWLGLRAEEASSALRAQLGLGEDEGLVVMDVVEDGPADKADLRVNDILLKLGEHPLGTRADLRDALNDHQVGQTVTIEYLRRGAKGQTTAILGKRPNNGGNDAKGQQQLEDMKKRLQEMMKQNGAAGVDVQGGNNSFRIEVNGDNIQDLDGVLNHPNLPDEFKQTVRDMLSRMPGFDEKPGED